MDRLKKLHFDRVQDDGNGIITLTWEHDGGTHVLQQTAEINLAATMDSQEKYASIQNHRKQSKQSNKRQRTRYCRDINERCTYMKQKP